MPDTAKIPDQKSLNKWYTPQPHYNAHR